MSSGERMRERWGRGARGRSCRGAQPGRVRQGLAGPGTATSSWPSAGSRRSAACSSARCGV